jgi:hypothetical protein
MSEVIDFSQVDVPQSNKYLEPGMYRLKIDAESVKLMTPQGKNPYLTVTFINKDGASVTEKFFLTKKALPRLQYLHEAWFSKKLTSTFATFEEVGKYFAKVLTTKIVARPMIVGGKIAPDGKFWVGLPFDGFVVVDETKFVEGPFDKDSDEYKRVVRVEKPNSAVANTDSPVLPSSDSSVSGDEMPDPWD